MIPHGKILLVKQGLLLRRPLWDNRSGRVLMDSYAGHPTDHLDAKKAGELSTLFDVGGIFGGILAGVISDRLEKRASTCGLMLLLAAPTVSPGSARRYR